MEYRAIPISRQTDFKSKQNKQARSLYFGKGTTNPLRRYACKYVDTKLPTFNLKTLQIQSKAWVLP